MQDLPEGSSCLTQVTASRAGQNGSCLQCLYIHRGSFKQIALPSLVLQLNEHPQLKEKLPGID